ncbi:OmpP1/FadL family transporter [Pseudoroseicyclus aestuarii]|uniref:Long-subunit fatty acid transport protein n=1 Tax=Pseudoroseicyclus aestuarii TaxID=1795041 RepID=A0A318T6T9_9RHOB|nr:outer membrane protein transport protein [Pseudoroseicyclus aestuarii]PYE86184.1 long-subunit fatty acid transport protein [Pseudoroseicyclus aestuarii]
MKTFATASGILLLGAGAAGAVGLDRSNQDITAIFAEDNYLELSYARTEPSLSGADLDIFPTLGDYGDVGEVFTTYGASLTYHLTPRISMALIADEPFGVDTSYEGDPALTMLGGTSAELNSRALTLMGRYRINDAFSIHGGLRRERLDAEITLSGQAYGGLNGYRVSLDEDSATGYVIGAAYERPEIALRVALTYHSSMEHDFDSTETLGGAPIGALPPALTGGLDGVGTTTVETPEAWNLDFQTGIAQDTLLFANVRYATYSDVIVSPEFFAAAGGGSLTEIEDNASYQIGVGRRFNEAFSGQIAVGYEPEKDDFVSPLAPTNGLRFVSLGGSWTRDAVTLSGGVRYSWIGDAFPETGTPDVARAQFEDNDAISYGLSLGYRF